MAKISYEDIVTRWQASRINDMSEQAGEVMSERGDGVMAEQLDAAAEQSEEEALKVDKMPEEAAGGSLAERYRAMQEKFDSLLAELNDLKKKDRALVYEWYNLRDGRRLRILILIAVFCVGLTTGTWLFGRL